MLPPSTTCGYAAIKSMLSVTLPYAAALAGTMRASAVEDFGGHATHGPAAVWQLRELRDLRVFNEARRAAGSLCQLSVGFLVKTPCGRQLLPPGWPQLGLVGDHIVYWAQRLSVCGSAHANGGALREQKPIFSVTNSLDKVLGSLHERTVT